MSDEREDSKSNDRGDVDIELAPEEEAALTSGEKQGPGPEPSADPANLDHPEVLQGE